MAAGADSFCFGGTPPATRLHFELPNGYAFELARNPDSLAYEVACEARVLDVEGDTVWQRVGFNAQLDSWTGHDVNGDGRPNLVVGVDPAGGNHDCCWIYTLFSLGATARVLDTAAFHPWFAEDSHGRTLLYEWVPFYDLGYSMANSPAFVAVFRFQADTLANVTRDHCAGLLGDSAPPPGAPRRIEHPSIEELAASRAISTDDTEMLYAVEKTRMTILSLALQELECGHADAARALVTETWPASDADGQWARVETAWRKRAGP